MFFHSHLDQEHLQQKCLKIKDKFLKKAIPGTGAMFAQKEEVELDEGKMKTIATMFDQGKSAEEIAKALKLSLPIACIAAAPPTPRFT